MKHPVQAAVERANWWRDHLRVRCRPRLPEAPISNRLMVNDIQKVVAQYFNIPVAEMISDRRSVIVARPRQIAMYLAKKLTARSLPDIGSRFGHRDHSTVIHAVKRIEDLRSTDVEMDEAVRSLIALLSHDAEEAA